MDPREVRAHLGLADCAIARGEDKDGIVEELLAAAADSAECDRAPDAFSLFGKALATDPGRLEIHIDIAELEAATGRGDMASSRMENLARTYNAMGLNEDAEAVLEVAALFRGEPAVQEPAPPTPVAQYVAPVMTSTAPPLDQQVPSGGTQVAPAPTRPTEPTPAASSSDAATYVAPVMRLAVPGPAAVVDPQTREKARRNTIPVTPPPTRARSARTMTPPAPPTSKATVVPAAAEAAPAPTSPQDRRRKTTGEYSGARPIQPAATQTRRRKAAAAPAPEARRAAPGKARPRVAAPPRPQAARRAAAPAAAKPVRARTPAPPQERPAPSRAPSRDRKKLVLAKAPHPTNLGTRLRQQSNRVRLDPLRTPADSFEEQATRLWAPEGGTEALSAALGL